jgi:hypothetical protein
LLFSLAPDALNVVLLAYFARTFLKGYYRDRLGMILLVCAGLMVIFLTRYSYRMSQTAARSLVQAVAPEIEQAAVAPIDSLQRISVEKLGADYEKDRRELEEHFAQLLKASTEPLSAQLTPLQTQMQRLEESRSPNNTFYIDLQQRKLRKQIQPLEQQLLNTRKTLVEQQEKRLNALRAKYDQDRKQIQTQYQSERSEVQSERKEKKQSVYGMTQVFSRQLSWIAGYAVFIVLVLTTIREILYHRNGIDLQPIISPFDFQTKPLRETLVLPFVAAGRHLINLVRQQYQRLPALADPPAPPALKPYVINQLNEPKVEVEPAEESDLRESSTDYDSLFSESETDPESLKEKPSLNGAYDNRMPEQTTIVVDNSKLKNCHYCEVPFLPNHKKQKYCCEDHRKAAWEERNGRKLMLRRKK